jgi:hypothetical protein
MSKGRNKPEKVVKTLMMNPTTNEPSKVEIERRRWRGGQARGRSDNGDEEEENWVQASGGGERGEWGEARTARDDRS